MQKSFRLILILFVFQMSCQSQTEKVKSASDEIEIALKSSNEWLKKVDSSYYGKSWETSSELFKNSIIKDNWVKTLGSLRSSLGKVISREIQTKKYQTKLHGAPDGEYVVIIYETEFENKEKSYEIVTPMKDSDGKWRVSGYYIK